MDERLQIDALLITENVVCIIDFKNFEGIINLPIEENFEFGIWSNNKGEQVRGGSTINPFIQLKNQKRRFTEVFTKHIQKKLAEGDHFNSNHTVKIICFQNKIKLNGKIPLGESLNFFILDKINYLEGILDIIDIKDKDVKITPTSYEAFKKVFRADQFKLDDQSLYDKPIDLSQKTESIDYTKLTPDQSSAIEEIKAFLENENQHVFILHGTTNSGKSYLIPFIQDAAYSLGIHETEIFASSGRIANNLVKVTGLDNVNSIYSYIYGGQKKQLLDEENNESLENAEFENIQLEQIPLKKCDGSENSLFIVDESQLVSDSFYESIDLIFGTGYLLKDFIEFTDLLNSKRKIIFIGDPYQLQFGKLDESPLNTTYLEEAYKLKTSSYQLLDKPDYSVVTKQVMNCADAVRRKYFNYLRFTQSENFCFLPKDHIKDTVTNLVINKSGHILNFSNEDAHTTNLWVKQSIINNGSNIAKNDLVMFNNNISIEDVNDPFAEPKRVYDGEFALVLDVTNEILNIPIINKKKEKIILQFREMTLRFVSMDLNAKVLSFENYRLNPRAEISKEETVAYKILLNTEIMKCIKENPFEISLEYDELVNSISYKSIEEDIKKLESQIRNGEKVKTSLEEKRKDLKRLIGSAKKRHRNKIETSLRKDPSTKYYKFRNAALLRYGWAMTVHKSMSYKWDEVIFNVEPGKNIGKGNQHHFRWLYTGISRAKLKVALINYKPISPFDSTELVDSNTRTAQSKFFFISGSNDKEKKLLELKHFISNKLTNLNTTIIRIDSLNWQERYYLIRAGNTSILSISYNSEGRFKNPTFVGGDNVLGHEIIKILTDPTSYFSFSSIIEDWRKAHYEILSKELANHFIRFSQIIQTNYKDKIKFLEGENELDVEVDYNNDGFFTKITAKYYSNLTIWENLKSVIRKINNSM